jgi:hypothetical protein
VSAITLPRGAPREVYRVYTEDDYLAGVDGPLETAAVTAEAEHTLRRVAGAAMLVGAFAAVGGVLAFNGLSPSAGTARRLGASVRGARGRLIAARRSYPREGLGRGRVIHSARPVGEPARVSQAPRTRLTPGQGRDGLRSRVVPVASHRRDLVAGTVAEAGAVQTSEVPAAMQEDVVNSQANASAQSPSASQPPQPAEFGFER